jgi:hypothetical protein
VVLTKNACRGDKSIAESQWGKRIRTNQVGTLLVNFPLLNDLKITLCNTFCLGLWSATGKEFDSWRDVVDVFLNVFRYVISILLANVWIMWE